MKGDYMTKIEAIVLLSCYIGSACAQDAPTTDILYSKTEGHSLVYRCGPVQAGSITCELTEQTVRLKATEADLSARLETARKDYKTEPPMTAEQCKGARELDDILGGRRPSTLRPEHELTVLGKADSARSVKTLVAYCDKPSEQTFLALARDSFDQDRRTCKISTQSSKQTFKPVQQVGSRVVWVAQDGGANGPCGIVDLSRFERQQATALQGFSLWNFILRRAVTNPNASASLINPAVKCSAFDEAPFEFEWKPHQLQMSCDYIEFVPL